MALTLTLTGPRIAALATTAVLAIGTPTAYAALDSDSGSATAKRGAPYVETRLFFGTERPDGGPAVTDKQFMSFVNEEVTPSFPDGLTVQNGRGQWRDSNGKIERERSYELILMYPTAEAAKRDPQIETIRKEYRRMYAQDSVARSDDRTRVDF
ncbi:DUF3574 domain-containing protein [Streptomyces sp. NPDC059009]|uniref:DUF3574 domain-containing protein n=1 Tax=Streptomyces sp. NPDC059009 TaxID=3346694 RepID=UPI0036A6A8D8